MEQHFAVFDSAGETYGADAVRDDRHKDNQQRYCHDGNRTNTECGKGTVKYFSGADIHNEQDK